MGSGARLGTLLSSDPEPEPLTSGQPLDLSALARGGAPTVDTPPPVDVPASPPPQTQLAAIAPTGDARTDYDRAYNLIIAGNYDVAEASFRQFLQTYPKNDLAADAQYWLGESLFARARYDEAAVVFRDGYKAYPKSQRAPDTLLKLGLSLAGLGERDQACQIYAAALKQYPQMSNALRQRVANERATSAC